MFWVKNQIFYTSINLQNDAQYLAEDEWNGREDDEYINFYGDSEDDSSSDTEPTYELEYDIE